MKLIDVSVSFKKKEVLKQVNLDLSKPGIYGVLGANGVGKTTLFKVMTGRLLFNGDMIRNKVSITYILSDFTEIKRIYNQLSKDTKRFSKSSFDYYVDLFNIDMKLKKYDIDKEQAALLIIALTLSIDSDIYLLDEPFNDLNAINRKKVIQAMIQLQEQGKTIIVSTHVVDVFENVFDQVILVTKVHKIIQMNIETLNQLSFSESKENAIGSIEYLGTRKYLHLTQSSSQNISLKQCYEAIVEGVL